MIEEISPFIQLKNYLEKEKKAIREIGFFYKHYRTARNIEEKRLISSQINSLKSSLKITNKNVLDILNKINLPKPLVTIKKAPKPSFAQRFSPKKPVLKKEIPISSPSYLKREIPPKDSGVSTLEEETLKRIREKEEKVEKKKITKPSRYVRFANQMFSSKSMDLLRKSFFKTLERDLIKSKIRITPISYVSVVLLTSILSIILGFCVFLFFSFFNLSASAPFLTPVVEDFGSRFLKVFWILFLVPIFSFLIMYFYPSLEKKSAEIKINRELPFAAIHMSAISGSMIEPSKIFDIVISTKEYPSIEKEFTRIINEINIYGYDLATALRNVAFNSPSSKLAELLNGLATTINSGGNLTQFFEKRAESLLFGHKIEKEKNTKAAETFMDIYISVVIAAPMILMLLLMMMSISGLSWLSPTMITLIMVLGVTVANIIFLTFLHLKGSTE